MKSKKTMDKTLQKTRSTLLSAISELDPRGTDEQITKAMCIIDATFDAVASGKQISPSVAFKRGLDLVGRTDL
jgi:hypothetical protein